MSAPMAKPKTVELFYDVISPFAWIGFEVIGRYKNVWNIDLKLKPFFLGGIMQGADNRPPATVPRKAVYLQTEVIRLGNHYKIPIKNPSNFGGTVMEKGSLNAQRFITAVDMENPQYTENLSRELWLRVWSRDEDITQDESLVQAAKKAGLSEELIKSSLSKIKDQNVKDRLRQYTQEALDYGAFGAPTIVAHINGKAEMIFGSDRFPVLADMLGEKYYGPLEEFSRSKL